MKWLARTRIAFGLTLAALFLVIGPGCAGGAQPTNTGCGRSGGSSVTPQPVPLSRYVGTWKGSWAALDNLDPLPRGEMTLTVDSTGAFSGQLTDTANNRTGSVFGKITAQGADGSADITTVFGERSARNSTQILIVQTNGRLSGSMSVPVEQAALPGEVPFILTLASFDLTRQ